ncbi:rhomboid family intramembrane serine protease [Fibrobacterota bacterium]
MTRNDLPSFSEEMSEILFMGNLNKVMEVSLLFASQNIQHRITYQGAQYGLEVRPSDRITAEELLSLYHQENKDWKIELESPGDIQLSPAPFLFLLVPTVGFFFQMSSRHNTTLLTYAGRCDANKILSGEWWRTFTGLTLHGDLHHYLSNLVAGYFIINLLMNRINPGLTVFLISCLAGLANFFTAMHSPSGHLSLGFSTAVFSALGFLSAFQAKQNYLLKIKSQKPWAPIIAAFFIVTLIGLGEGSDIRAHLYGFAAGILGGLGLSGLDKFTRKIWSQTLFLVAAYGLFIWSWYLAMD